MSDKAPAIAGPINHVKVIVLALVASMMIMLVGLVSRPTDDTRGYGLVPIRPASVMAQGIDGGVR